MKTSVNTKVNALSYNEGPAVEVTGPATELPGERKPYFLDAGTGPRRNVPPRMLITRMITSKETNGRITVSVLEGRAEEHPLPAHLHEHEDHLFFVLEGRLRVWVGNRHRLLYPGDTAFLPSGLPHSFRMEGAYNKFLSVNTPGGFEKFFDTIGEAADDHVAPYDMVETSEERWKKQPPSTIGIAYLITTLVSKQIVWF